MQRALVSVRCTTPKRKQQSEYNKVKPVKLEGKRRGGEESGVFPDDFVIVNHREIIVRTVNMTGHPEELISH